MNLIDQFIDRYTKEYDFYSHAARLVAQVLESDLRSAGIRCIVSHRAKDIERLKSKCIQRDAQVKYESVEQIFEDIVDLAGVRVALYFPGEQEQVDKAIARLFDQWAEKRVFPGAEKPMPNRRFSGYSAVHYRVQPREKYIGDSGKRYLKARVEIQVASVLMHAWSEVEHDLAYKQMAGDLSSEEHAILDQLNGLVLAGEISLRLLQEAGESRVALNGANFLNHYELAAHLLRHAHDSLAEPVGDSGLGKVDDLYALLKRLEKTTPVELEPYLESLHGAVDERPLAEQVVDALLAEDPTRYVIYDEVRSNSQSSELGRQRSGRDAGISVLEFFDAWVDLESALNRKAEQFGLSTRNTPVPVIRLVRLLGLTPEIADEINLFRYMRNDAVHRGKRFSAAALDDAVKRLRQIIESLDGDSGIALPIRE
ncbi:RelA/SpoT domain-containing protein [Streptomyces prasinus]|uniref:RelA/SpoT domain-containing protein n=1 Tax=Streptomyces prasinus TaxID=67345 RepID=UPI00099F0CEB|nr:RelA/SpoT domain-containing protein [Streptomyces prasinus]